MQVREDIVIAIGEAVALRAAELRAFAEASTDLTTIATEAAAQFGEPSAKAPSFCEADHYHDTTDVGAGPEATRISPITAKDEKKPEVPSITAANDIASDNFEVEPAHSVATIPRAGAVSSLVWGVMGFLIGAVFWHFIGFWGFISEIVFVGGAVREERLVEQTGQQCVQLVLDRSAGTISSEACPFDAPLLNEGALAVRTDFVGDRGPKTVAARPAIRLTDGSR